MRTRTTRTPLRAIARIGAVLSVSAASVLLVATPGYADTATVSPARGPSGGGNTIVLTNPTTNFTGSPAVLFHYTTCPASYASNVTPVAGASTPFALTAGTVRASTVAIQSDAKKL